VYVLPGQRLPLTPPLGTVFVAWSDDDEVERWLAKLGPSVTKKEIERQRRALEAVFARGYSVGLEGGGRPARSQEGRPLTLEESIKGVRTEEYAVLDLEPGSTYRVNHIGAPVFGPDGGVAIALFIIGFPGRISGSEVDRIAERLTTATARATKGIHGRSPDSP
jgi:DNA-binding IclR family transcriptional regulator